MLESYLDLIGNTEVLKLEIDNIEIGLKLEANNPTGSIKARTVLGMVLDAEKNGVLTEGATLVEPTSGNTGIALAMIGKLKGYDVKIVMPETMSDERKTTIKSYGAELILTPGDQGMKGSINKVEAMVEANEDYVYLDQFTNPANPAFHYETTGKEIIEQLPALDYFIAGVGTGGSLSGIGQRLKEETDVKVYAIEPEESAVISGDEPGPHKIQGIGAGFIPDTFNSDIIDGVITVNTDEAYAMTKRLKDEYGLLFGLSTGANVAGAVKLAQQLNVNKNIATINCDIGERYISTGVYL